LIRIFDILIAATGLLILSPLIILIALLVLLSGGGGILFRQVRVGRYGKKFTLFKFRTMKAGKEKGLMITVKGDNRVTRPGKILRKYKLDELPQLINVIVGNMSLVGPRPEIPEFVDQYTEDQREVLKVRPGITDLASIECRNEEEILAKQADPETYYREVLIPYKIALNKKFIENPSFKNYIRIIFITLRDVGKDAGPSDSG
jgi:lipopolysaccharide/colanic/teichoic acid biosynthesis glycosyltransferase